MQREELVDSQARTVAKALRESEADSPGRRFQSVAGGDPRAMRGTPIMTKGVRGNMPRTQPEAGAMRRLGERAL